MWLLEKRKINKEKKGRERWFGVGLIEDEVIQRVFFCFENEIKNVKHFFLFVSFLPISKIVFKKEKTKTGLPNTFFVSVSIILQKKKK